VSRLVLLVLVASSCGSSSGGAAVDADTSVTGDGAAATADGAVTAASCTGKQALSGDLVWTLTSSGLPRTLGLHVPVGYDPTHPTPVVLNFHGFTSDDLQEDLLTDMDPRADENGYVAIYPVGTGVPLSWNAGACCGTAEATNIDDIQYVRDVIAMAESQLCVDPKRIFATGMSNGGFLSNRIGCELADQVAAIAPVAGVLGVSTCTPSRPMPVMHFHGTADPLVPYDGSTVLGFISVADSIAGWVARDGCTGSPVQTYANGDATCDTYQTCAAGADVTLCTIQGGGHTWPGGLPVPALGLTSTDISATDAMWTFFVAHPMP
jgi:polyhydroxybutyrate depolymerase